MKTRSFLFSFICLLLPLTASEQEQILKSKMLSDLDVIQNVFEVKYAPFEWKYTFAKWDLEQEISKAKNKVVDTKNITVTDYQHILGAFFRSTRDYHVSLHLHATEAALLPFGVREADGRYFISWVSRNNTSATFAPGDEIITFGEKPIAQAIAELKATELGNPESLTDQAKAEIILTSRLAASGRKVPSGSIKISVKPKKNPKAKTFQFTWSHTPEEVHNELVYAKRTVKHAAGAKQSDKKNNCFASSIFKKQMIDPEFRLMNKTFQQFYGKPDPKLDPSDQPEPIGAKVSFVPALGKALWQTPTTNSFHAYIFNDANNKRIGYIRISDYMGGEKAPEVAAHEFLTIIQKFQTDTDALIIDEVNNPGGMLFYMYALLSMLTDKPLETPVHREIITQEEVMLAIEALEDFNKFGQASAAGDQADIESELRDLLRSEDSIDGYPLTALLIDQMSSYFKNTVDEWNAGNFITAPTHVYGIKDIPPHASTRYTKPILVLVNELSISCGDFFPAILQDNKRATIFGTQTAGAGGCVLPYTHANRFGIAEYYITGSIAERTNKQPIENLGVTPDIVYKPTANDLQNKYVDYRNAVLKAVDGLFKK